DVHNHLRGRRSSRFSEGIHDSYTELIPAGPPTRKAIALQSRWSMVKANAAGRPSLCLRFSCRALTIGIGWSDMEDTKTTLGSILLMLTPCVNTKSN
ncbi:hypothetical protein GN958_ATG00203, partial [Phytophthora infestans]